jgi:tyrosyl-tRNA synthetase
LNSGKFSSYNLYQYFFNLNDELAQKLLKQLTDITEVDFNVLVKKSNSNPKERIIQLELAKRLISIIHDAADFDNSQVASSALFSGDYDSIDPLLYNDVFNSVPTLMLEDGVLINIITNQLGKSKREYREFLVNNSIKVNGKLITQEEYIIND